jgi:hypothetical protein
VPHRAHRRSDSTYSKQLEPSPNTGLQQSRLIALGLHSGKRPERRHISAFRLMGGPNYLRKM